MNVKNFGCFVDFGEVEYFGCIWEELFCVCDKVFNKEWDVFVVCFVVVWVFVLYDMCEVVVV